MHVLPTRPGGYNLEGFLRVYHQDSNVAAAENGSLQLYVKIASPPVIAICTVVNMLNILFTFWSNQFNSTLMNKTICFNQRTQRF